MKKLDVEDCWNIVSARYETGCFYIEFQDGIKGLIPVVQFLALTHATEADFEHLEVSPCGLVLETENIKWDCAEAGLYKIVSSSALSTLKGN